MQVVQEGIPVRIQITPPEIQMATRGYIQNGPTLIQNSLVGIRISTTGQAGRGYSESSQMKDLSFIPMGIHCIPQKLYW